MKPRITKPPSGLLMLCFVVLFSCKKQDAQITTQPDSAEFQKVSAWIDAQKLELTDSGIAKIVALRNNLVPSGLRMEKFNEKENLIIIPLKSNFKTVNVTDQKSFKQLVLVENESGIFRRGDIIEIIPKNQNQESVTNGVISSVYNNKTNNLDGVFSISTITNKLVYELAYRQGKISSTKHLTTNSTGSIIINTSGKVQGCTAWYLVTTTYYDDGSTDESREYLYTSCQDGCGLEERTIAGTTTLKVSCSGGDGGSSTASPTSIVTIDTIIKILANKCLLNVVNVVGSAEFKNQIVKLYNETYSGNAQVANLKFEEAGVLNNTDGSPRAASSSIDQSTYTWVVILNTNYGDNVSNEFWASAIIHELVHSFLTIYTQNKTQPITLDEQHQAIFDKWIKQMADFLTQSYGMNKTDATALALGGLDDVLKEYVNDDAVFKPKYDAMAQKKYGISLATAEQTRNDYKTGLKGTKCNPNQNSSDETHN